MLRSWEHIMKNTTGKVTKKIHDNIMLRTWLRIVKYSVHIVQGYWISRTSYRQTVGQSLGDHLSSESARVTPSSVMAASIVLCSVSLWLVWVNVQWACALNTWCKKMIVHVLNLNNNGIKCIKILVFNTFEPFYTWWHLKQHLTQSLYSKIQ
jgi:hypothetical protein